MSFNQKQKDAYQKAAFVCSRAEKCSNKIRQKLLDWELDVDEAQAVLDKLVAEKYIDDERYSRSFVRDKFRFNKWGRIKIAYQLRAERIQAPIIDSALEEIDEEEYAGVLAEILLEKSKKIKAANQYDKKAKLLRFAQSRGFENDLIFKTIEKIITA